MGHIKIAMLLVISMITSSCASSVVPPARWEMQEEGIILRISSDKNLHNENGIPKPLNIVIYQLTDTKKFNQMADEKTGLYKMLKCTKYDHSVVDVRKIKLMPGSDSVIRIDRLAEARHVAIVAGYSAMKKESMVRLFPIPVYVKKTRLFSRERCIRPGRLDARVAFGADEIKRITAVSMTTPESRSNK